jgi:hypothetical protein
MKFVAGQFHKKKLSSRINFHLDRTCLTMILRVILHAFVFVLTKIFTREKNVSENKKLWKELIA